VIAQFLRAAFTENLNLKFLSLAFALVLYSVVHDAQDAKRTVEVKVDFRDPPESADRVRATPIPPHLRVTLRGPRAMLNDLNSDNMSSVKIDLRAGTESRVVFEPGMVTVPPGVKVEQIEPAAIDLVWEDRIQRDVPIQCSVAGTPSPGFVVKGLPAPDPSNVRVRGPKSEVVVLQHVRADPFDVNGLTEGRHTRPLALDRPRGRVTYEVPSVTVTVDIAREMTERPFTKIPVAVVGPGKAKTQPAEVDVRLTCPPDLARALRTEQIVPRVEVETKDEHGIAHAPVLFNVDGCEAVVTPKSVIVRW
jgi:YbbR domain-containing protein